MPRHCRSRSSFFRSPSRAINAIATRSRSSGCASMILPMPSGECAWRSTPRFLGRSIRRTGFDASFSNRTAQSKNEARIANTLRRVDGAECSQCLATKSRTYSAPRRRRSPRARGGRARRSTGGGPTRSPRPSSAMRPCSSMAGSKVTAPAKRIVVPGGVGSEPRMHGRLRVRRWRTARATFESNPPWPS